MVHERADLDYGRADQLGKDDVASDASTMSDGVRGLPAWTMTTVRPSEMSIPHGEPDGTPPGRVSAG